VPAVLLRIVLGTTEYLGKKYRHMFGMIRTHVLKDLAEQCVIPDVLVEARRQPAKRVDAAQPFEKSWNCLTCHGVLTIDRPLAIERRRLFL
jgi:hypothetical protein